MRNAVILASLLALACGAALASQPTAPGAGKILPNGPASAAKAAVAVNPQPLPPIHGDDAPTRVAINPQPLPPHNPPPGGEATVAGGEPPVVVDIRIGRHG